MLADRCYSFAIRSRISQSVGGLPKIYLSILLSGKWLRSAVALRTVLEICPCACRDLAPRCGCFSDRPGDSSAHMSSGSVGCLRTVLGIHPCAWYLAPRRGCFSGSPGNSSPHGAVAFRAVSECPGDSSARIGWLRGAVAFRTALVIRPRAWYLAPQCGCDSDSGTQTVLDIRPVHAEIRLQCVVAFPTVLGMGLRM